MKPKFTEKILSLDKTLQSRPGRAQVIIIF